MRSDAARLSRCGVAAHGGAEGGGRSMGGDEGRPGVWRRSRGGEADVWRRSRRGCCHLGTAVDAWPGGARETSPGPAGADGARVTRSAPGTDSVPSARLGCACAPPGAIRSNRCEAAARNSRVWFPCRSRSGWVTSSRGGGDRPGTGPRGRCRGGAGRRRSTPVHVRDGRPERHRPVRRPVTSYGSTPVPEGRRWPSAAIGMAVLALAGFLVALRIPRSAGTGRGRRRAAG